MTVPNNVLKEWEETRTILSRFDGYLDGLRKYGFSFIAALLAASSVQCFVSLDKNTRGMLILLSIVFILGLRLLDYYYEGIMQAAAKRSKSLETMLGFEIYNEISYKYTTLKLPLWITFVYSLFLFVASMLGYFVENVPGTSINFTNTTIACSTGTDTVNITTTNTTIVTTTIVDTGVFSIIFQSIYFWLFIAACGIATLVFIHIKSEQSSARKSL